jgi:N-acetylmuramoyl-L-alanine amidase
VSKIAKIVVHCSDSPDNLDIGAAEIRVWHTAKPPGGRGWRDIGYHYVIRRDGTVETGRYENGDSVLEGREIGAHVLGHNSDSLAVCLVGRKQFARAQLESLTMLVRCLLVRTSLPKTAVLGHYELDKHKTCPNLDMDLFRNGI